ncbi:MAG: phosphatidylserine decarboxylase [Halobacteria archaeon]
MALVEAFAVAAAALGGFLLLFYRDPERVPDGPGMVSPADGRVIVAEPGRIAVFLNLHDVHVNRAPLGGRVVRVRHTPGRFRPAFGATGENERNEIDLETPAGPVRVTQVAGFVARRIVCSVREGQRVARGERIGRILLGSRTDVTVPPGFRVVVAEGQRVKGGRTVIAIEREGA